MNINYCWQVENASSEMAGTVDSKCKLFNSNFETLVLIFGCRVQPEGTRVHINW